MSEVAWIRFISTGYISGLSVNAGLVALVAPPPDNNVHVLDAATGETRGRLLGRWVPHSVAVTPTGSLMCAAGVRVGLAEAASKAPAIGLSPIEDGRDEPAYLLTGELPRYNNSILFGKIALFPDRNEALISGVSDRYDTKGFLLHASWSSRPRHGRFAVIATDIDEAPHDLAIVDDRAYIPTGRGGSVVVLDLKTYQRVEPLRVTTGTFKPTRIVATEKYMVVASYNRLYWWEHGAFDETLSLQDVTSPNDCVNGLAVLDDDTIVCALTYSDRLVTTTLPTKLISDLKRSQRPANPCWIEANPNGSDRFYVTGHTNGYIWAMDTSPQDK